MKRQIFYFISQNTFVAPEIFEAEAITLGYDKKDYFPLQKVVNSKLY